MYIFYLIEQHSKFSLRTLQVLFENFWIHLKCIVYDKLLNPSVRVGVCSCTDGSRNSQRAPVRYVRYVTKTWSDVLLNKKKTHILLFQVCYV